MTSSRPRRRTLLRAAPLALATAALTPALASCTRASERLDAESNAVPEVDLSDIAEVPEIAALVPADIRERGEIVNGAALNYAPGEFVGSNGQAIGYDMDILAGIGAVLGLRTRTEAAVFAQIIPAVGSTYDVGISSFTINEERLAAVSMVSYFQAGISYAVRTGNPYDIDPENLCGKRVALQVGTYQEELSIERSQECRDQGERAYDMLAYASNSDAATNVAGGKGDILMADSPVTAYAVARSRGTLEEIGEIEESALNGIVVAKDQPELAEAIRAALQHLIDNGHMERILAAWGNEAGMIPTAEVNPQP
ncbi:ABC transporter substrate-binding protein [Brachybacterium aquaticum]|uniref:Polar amino acid transport system substrate-binding protein n=1 Tax=Brachybacterium aquaticum TaxID=1432564 RepID=A0A841A632_9MICO|nr:ABC transporter substrate-binding protein [Brachybacterium aquaticum]MBB5830306.1 polar amino acid transport system substrate-binding protein [Brachybacterium aquaticum]